MDPTPNLIFKLNFDCLTRILSFLRLPDLYKVFKADERFRSSMLFERAGPDIHSYLLGKEYEEFRQLIYKNYGPRARKMAFNCRNGNPFWEVIRHFPALKELEVCNLHVHKIPLSDNVSEILPVGLTKLKIVNSWLPEEVLEKWFIELDGKLTHFHLMDVFDRFKTDKVLALKNITSLIINIRDHHVVEQLINNNSNHLRKLIISKNAMDSVVWSEIEKLRGLKELDVNLSGLNGSFPKNLFPELNSLTLRGNFSNEFLSTLTCDTSLSKISIAYHVKLSNLLRFKNLKHVELRGFDWTGNIKLIEVSQLQQIDSLAFMYGKNQLVQDVVDLIIKLPNLRKLLIDGVTFTGERWKYPMEAKDALEITVFNSLVGIRNSPLEFNVGEVRIHDYDSSSDYDSDVEYYDYPKKKDTRRISHFLFGFN